MNHFKEMTERELAVAREIRRQNIQEIIGTVAFVALVILCLWLYTAATPDQRSAECELAAEQIETHAN